MLEALAVGDVKILVGTHAVIEDTVQFARLGLAVVDEQHRFRWPSAPDYGQKAKPHHIYW